MRYALPFIVIMIVAPFVLGCQSNQTQTPADTAADTASPAAINDKAVAYLDGKPVTQTQLYRIIAQAHGGDALTEILLDRAVQNRLKQEAIELTSADIQAERDLLLASLDSNPDQAARLLKEMRDERGLGEQRFAAMLRRNAGLRRLVRDQITITEAAIAQAYELRFGQRYQVRLIVADKLDTLTDARKQALAGSSFTDLAIKLSTDPSARQGGLLSPINPADPRYPKAIRDALPKLNLDNTASRISQVIALDTGYALLCLEDIISEDAPPIEAVRNELQAAVRTNLERLRMRQLARTLIEQANVVVLDPGLDMAWKRQQKTLDSP